MFEFVERHELHSNEIDILSDENNNFETIIYNQDTIFVDRRLLVGKGDLR